jgi:RNA polymerase sigma factor (sigma-70 family)
MPSAADPRPRPSAAQDRSAGRRLAVYFDRHGRMVYGLCTVLLRDPLEAEDAAQQSFLSAYRAMLSGVEPRDPAAWLAAIARNECRLRIRGRMRASLELRADYAAVAASAQDAVERKEQFAALYEALRELPEGQRNALVLRDVFGLRYREVSAALGISLVAVESLLFRARRRVQARLRPLRDSLGGLLLPPALERALTESVPAFAAGGASAGVGAAAAATMAKVAAAPAAKVAAVSLAVGAAGGSSIADQRPTAPPEVSPAVAGRVSAAPPARPAISPRVPVQASGVSGRSEQGRGAAGEGEDDESVEHSGPGGSDDQARETESADDDHSGPGRGRSGDSDLRAGSSGPGGDDSEPEVVETVEAVDTDGVDPEEPEDVPEEEERGGGGSSGSGGGDSSGSGGGDSD